jgi:osmotically-inducible protein OsmY
MIVSDQLSIEPSGFEGGAKKIESNVDDSIGHDFKAALIGNKLEDQHINYSVKNGVITLTGTVDSSQLRKQAEQIAASVPNVEQVVNELKVSKSKAAGGQ